MAGRPSVGARSHAALRAVLRAVLGQFFGQFLEQAAGGGGTCTLALLEGSGQGPGPRPISFLLVTPMKEFTITDRTSSRLRTDKVAEQFHDEGIMKHGIVFGGVARCAQLKELCVCLAAAPRSPSLRPPG